jgi:hypothetical protein
MSRTLRLTAVAAILGGTLIAAIHAPALGQPAAPPGAAEAPAPGRDGPPPWARGRGGPGGHEHGGPRWGMPGMGGPAGRLFAFRQDKALTPDEVRRIAEGFLLYLGEREWRVVDVAEGPDNTVTFGVAPREGVAFMRFAMDRRTGQVRRIG